MQVSTINYSNTNSHGMSASADKNLCCQINSAVNVSDGSFQSTKKDNITFSGHTLKELSFIERIKLKKEVINGLKSRNLYRPRKRVVRDIFTGSKEALRTDYQLQLAQYLLNHEAMRVLDEDFDLNDNFVLNLTFKEDFYWILKFAAHKEEDEYGNQIIDIKKTKANAEAMMDFADFIVKLPIYNHKFVKALLFKIIAHVDADNIDQRKFMANYVAKHPETLENEWHVHENLVLNDGYELYKDMGYARGAKVDWGGEFFKTEDFKQSEYYRRFGATSHTFEFEETSEELSTDSILNKLSSTKYKGLSQEEVDYLAKIMELDDSEILMRLNYDSRESKNLYYQLYKKYNSETNNSNNEAAKLLRIITLLRNNGKSV